MQVGAYRFGTDDFEYVYQKNLAAGHQTVDECLALYIPYKLKIVAALDADLNKLPAIADKWRQYRNQLTAKKLTDTLRRQNLLREAYDGLLLMAITDTMVWSKTARDTVGLMAFYRKNARAYRWERRMDATLYYCTDATVAERLRRMVHNKNVGAGQLPNGLFSFFCDADGPSPCLDTIRRMLPKDANTIADHVKWKKGCSKIVERNGKYVFLDVHAIRRPERKTFEEARGEALADFQDEMLDAWVKQLKKKYPVTIDSKLWADLKLKYAE
jgi:hypothetical protein